MEINKRILETKNFLESEYLAEISNASSMGSSSILIDFKKVAMFNPEIADLILDDYEDSKKAFEIAIDNIDDRHIIKSVRFFNLSSSILKPIWKIRADDIDKLIVIKGYIRKISDVLHGVSSARFECHSCGNVIPMLMVEKFRYPSKCGCGGKHFRLMDRQTFDLQKLVIEEDPMELNSTQKPRRILVYLKDDLCKEEIDKTLQPSVKVQVTGLVLDRQMKKTVENLEYVKYIEANNIEILDETFDSFKFSEAEIKEFKEIGEKKTLYDDMGQSIFPNIYGHDIIKTAIFLQLIGGNHLYNDDVLEERGTMHIILVGSPGSGKTQMLKRAIQFIPNSRFTGGRGSSGVGLVAAVIKDEEMGGAVLDAGAVAMCNKSMCAIDELDKMTKSDIAMMNNAMNDLRVNIDKWNVHGTLETDTMILGAANPKNRVFDNRELIWKQIGLPKDFLDRFDLIFPMKVMSSSEDQKKVAGVIFGKYADAELTKPTHPRKFVTKYIAYARKFIHPKMTKIAEEYITDNFINLVKPKSFEEDQAYFSSRLLTNIIRIATASAKARLSELVEEEDALRSIEILVDSLRRQDIIKDSGAGTLTVDIERLEAIIPKGKRDKMKIIMGIIRDLEIADVENKFARAQDVVDKAESYGISEDDLEDYLTKLKQCGDLFEPRNGYYKSQ